MIGENNYFLVFFLFFTSLLKIFKLVCFKVNELKLSVNVKLPKHFHTQKSFIIYDAKCTFIRFF